MDHLAPVRLTTMVPATMSYTVLLCWKNSSVMNAGKKKAMEKFLFRALMVELQEKRQTAAALCPILTTRGDLQTVKVAIILI